MDAKPSSHVAVLVEEVLELLKAREGGKFLDCTFGGGGHSRAILAAHPESTLTACDRDPEALERAKILAAEFPGRVTALKSDFTGLKSKLPAGHKFTGILADLGMSTDQLQSGRGFSFAEEAPLDMRMDQESDLTCDVIINQFSEGDLRRVLKQGGAEQEAGQVARAIIKARPLKNTVELAAVCAAALPAQRAKKKSHPATVIFQALRIAVNDEIAQTKALLELAPKITAPHGRLAIIAFHSLEDRIVTKQMRTWANPGFSASFPGSANEKSTGKLITKKAVLPGEQEILRNPSARSARLRVFEFN